MEINALEAGYTQKDAFERLAKRSKHFSILNMNVLYYPYLRITYHVEMGKKLAKLGGKVVCVVDLFRETYSIAKSLGKYETIDVDEKKMMPIKADREAVIKKAPSQIYGDVMVKQKVLRRPEFQYLEDDIVYKTFYIVECKNEDGEFFHILFDAVTGDFSLLNA